METIGALRLRIHGASGPPVIVLHGGPAAVGSAAELARGLSDGFRVFEPWQRGSGPEALTVATHVEDLHALIQARCGAGRPAIVGESWGAMLALAYAAAYPSVPAAVALVGCGTFDPVARAKLNETPAARGRAPRPMTTRRGRRRATKASKSRSIRPRTCRPGRTCFGCKRRASIRRPSPRSRRRCSCSTATTTPIPGRRSAKASRPSAATGVPADREMRAFAVDGAVRARRVLRRAQDLARAEPGGAPLDADALGA